MSSVSRENYITNIGVECEVCGVCQPRHMMIRSMKRDLSKGHTETVAVCCNVMQVDAVCCGVLQCVAVCCSVCA